MSLDEFSDYSKLHDFFNVHYLLCKEQTDADAGLAWKKFQFGDPGIAYIVYLPIHSTLCHQYIQGPPKLKLTRGVEKNKEKSGYAS